jgi:adenine-specific DNA-methyltransferase
MKKLTSIDPESQSTDVLAENVAALAGRFPESIVEGAIDFEILKALLGVVEDGDEKYGLVWHGKRAARKVALTPSAATLRPVLEDSVEWADTKNLMIEGDNLEVLKLLQRSYSGKAKLIYIDPPYNTGKDFVYPDNFRDSIGNYLELSGQVDGDRRRITSNTESSGRFHTDWLNMMYPRLKLARTLLRDDGVIFVSIDDNEVENLRIIMNEIFGEENFLATIIWKKMDSPSRNAEDRAISDYHEYVVVYALDGAETTLNRETRESILEAFPLTLPDGRKARRRQLRKNGKSARRTDRPSMWFKLSAPDGSEVWPVAPEGWEGRWVLSPDTWEERTQAGLTEWIKRDGGWVPYYIELAPDVPTAPWSTLWTDVGQNRQAKAEFSALMGSDVEFENPKPVAMMRRIVQMATGPGDLVIDFFAGSGTMGQAVQEESALGSQRRYLLVQFPEPTTQAKYPTIADITKERLRRSAEKIRGTVQVATTDLGFRVFRLDSSNINAWDPDRDDIGASLLASVEHLKHDRTEEDILCELLLKLGLDLAVPIENRTLANKTVRSVGVGTLIACLAETIDASEIEDLALGIARWRDEDNPAAETVVVFRDSAFADDVAKTNITAILEQHGMPTVRSL